jgi:uncharacterized membrane protein YjfL (UPF0719 family)
VAAVHVSVSEGLIMEIFLVEVLITLVLIGLAKWLQDVLTVFDDDHELFTADNPALGIAKAGYYLSVMIALSGLWMGYGTGDWYEVGNFAVFGLLALVLMNISTVTVDRCILRNYKVYDLICGKRNEAVGWALAGSYLGSAFILRGAVSGDEVAFVEEGVIGARPMGMMVLEVIAYFALGQIVLILASELFDKINSPHHDALERGNASAGISFAGFLSAIGLIIGGMNKGPDGPLPLHLNGPDLFFFTVSSIVAIIALALIRRYAFPWMLSGGHCLREEIYRDQNKAAGFIMAFASLGLSQLLLVMWWSFEF